MIPHYHRLLFLIFGFPLVSFFGKSEGFNVIWKNEKKKNESGFEIRSNYGNTIK